MKLSLMFLEILFALTHTRQGHSKTTSNGDMGNGLLDRQKNYPLLLRIVKEGGHRGLTECQQQFKNEIWNCSLENKNAFYKQLPIFVMTTLSYATRETAFLHAISSAAITHEFTHQCSQNRIPECKCGKTRKQPKANIGWQWGGCSDDIKFGEKETRSFIDRLEKGNDARTAFNLHNNEVGRKVVRASLRKECKCHGVTGSCNLKTCWKQLAPFNVVGSELKQKYRTAVRVSFLNNKLHKEDNNRNRLVTKTEKKMVFLDSSPDYCVRNAIAGSPGMMGRTCKSEDASTEECRSLCNSCNLRHRTVEQYKKVKCRCKFVWCCTVKCKLCSAKYSLTTCV